MFQFSNVYWGASEQQPMKYRSSLGKSSLPLPTYYPTLKRLNCAFSVLTNIRDHPSFFLSIVAVFYESDLSSPSRSRHLVTRE
ncbi:hypothetical protein T12_8243 [Trichinella patagoniensis]|uniref:Uncharacterized protein n=1 Tax=Trichinella patagoniensis TaxID=990121 RepID=A0A0V0ZGX6_9BILA|nr:hypothetical protein T12_8243 [Trichinella patagoniensis]